MMNRGLRSRSVTLLTIAAVAAASVAAEEIGEVSALAESLAIIRDGELFPGAVEGGTAVEEEDLLLTGGASAEVVLNGLGRLRLWPETVVHLRGAAGGPEIELLAGTITFLRLGGSEPVPLLSGSIQLLIRSGEVTVGAYAGDRRMVVSERGRQMVRSEAGERRFAEPNLPVGYDGRLRNIQGSPLLWRSREVQRFTALGPGAMAQRFQEYLDLRARFDEAYQELLSYRRLLNRWSFRSSRNLPLRVEEDLTENPGLGSVLQESAEISERMEMRYYQLRLDEPYLPDGYRNHLDNEDAFLPDRLHFVRFLRGVTGLTDSQSAGEESPSQADSADTSPPGSADAGKS